MVMRFNFAASSSKNLLDSYKMVENSWNMLGKQLTLHQIFKRITIK